MRFILNRFELSGGLADIGVLLPIIVALAATNSLNPLITLLLCGLFYTGTSLYYQVPVPVQPLKVFCTVAIATKASPELISAGALLMGLIFLILAIPQVMNIIKKLFPLPIIRGIQLGTGLLLIDSGIKFYSSSQMLIYGPKEIVSFLNFSVPASLLIGVLCALILLILLRSDKYPAGLVLIILGIGVAVIYGAKFPSLLPEAEALKNLLNIRQIQIDTLFRSMWIFVLPQIPLSIGNAIIATEDTLKTYFGRQADKVEAGRLSFGMGCFNILSGLFGGIPCCHGCGGATAHYRFGARLGTATLFAGIFYTLIAAAIYFFGTSIFNFFPYPVLGILLIYAGIEHGLLIGDMTSRVDLSIVLVIASIAFATKNMSIAFISGMIVRKIAVSQKLFA